MFNQHPAKRRLPMFYTASSSPSLDQKLADGKGSCPGTFFHLFDWNCHDSHHGRQLFGHKPNPFGETTLDPTVKTCNDEVLPCTLVTNNINRCELSTANQTSLENCLPKVQIPKKKKKKSPNVVAKLMGLETMPSPEPCRRQRRPLDSQSPNLMQTPANAVYFPNIRVRSIKQRNLEGDETLEGRSIRLKSSRKKLLSDLSCKQGSENRARGNQHSPAQMQLEYAPVVSFQTQNREPNKLSLAARPASTASNFEGTQINIKHNEERLSKTQSLKMECVLSPAKTQANFKMVRGSEYTAAQASCTAVRVRAEKNKVGATSTSNSNVSPKLEETGQGQASKDNKYIKKDKCQVDCHSGHQPFSRKTDVNLTQGFKKTEQNSKQLCQLAGLKQAGARLQKFRSKLGASTLRESFEEPENLITQRNLSVDSTISRIQQADPSCSTKIISKHKRLSNHAKGASDKNGNIFKLQKTDTREIMPSSVRSLRIERGATQTSSDVMPRCESTFYPCHAQRGHCHAVAEFALESDVKDVDDGQSHSNGCGLEDMHSADSAFLTNLQDKSETLGSSLTFENDTFRVELQDGDVRGPSNSCTFQDNSGIEAVTSTLNVLEISKNPCQSTCESSIEDAGDTASSHERKNQRQAVSYSGKSTATILKELLLALNSSTKDFAAAKVCASEEDCSSLELIDVNNARRAESKCIDYFEGSVWNSCDTGNYCDEDLCHNPTQIDRVSSKNEPAVALETNCKFQEQAACLKVSSKSLIQCRTFQPSQGLSNNTQKSWQKAIESEESYVQCVVSSADLSPAKIISARLLCSGPLIKSWLFNEVEASCQSQWKWGLQHEYDEDNHSRSLNDYTGFLYARTAQTNRKLVFDCILEALREDMGITKQESMQTSLPVIDSPSYSLCSKRVHRQFDGWRAMACGLNVDDMVEKEMNSGFGKWHDFSCEIYHMSVEIELSMFSDLIDEIVPNLSTLITSVPMRMNHKLQGPVKAKKDQYFWVGL